MLKLLLSIAGLGLIYTQLSAQTVNFSYTGTQQTFVVPPCVTSINVTLNGAQGENSAVGGALGGLGANVSGTLAVTPGDILYIYVGGQNGYNGGGLGGQNGNNVFSGAPGILAANGGGASDIRLAGTALTDRVVVAGGGGGAGENGVWPGCQVAGPSGNGGNGGDLIGANGGFGVGTPCSCGGGGGDGGAGGTQAAGGLHGGYYGNTSCLRSNWAAGEDGSLGQGGNGSLVYFNGTGGGGGGGGGFYGGGSGGNGSDTTPGGGGGGGSSYNGPLTAVTNNQGTNSGDGSITIAYSASGTLADAPTSIIGNIDLCDNSISTFSIAPSNGAISYTWTVSGSSTIANGQGTTSIDVNGFEGAGTIDVTADNICGSSTAATISYVVHPLPIIDLGADNSDCESISLDAGAGYTYLWSDNSMNQMLIAQNSGTYVTTITDNYGCVNSDTIQITIFGLPTVTASAANYTPCDYAQNVVLTGTPAGGIWNGQSVTSNEFNPIIGVGMYDLTYAYTDGNGCSNADTITINVDDCLGIAEENSVSFVSVYPNPTSKDVTLEITAELLGKGYYLTDNTGRIILNGQFRALKETINLEQISTGVYFIKIDNNANLMYKIVKN